ncbi:class I adenylate-forming enzyme family protein [Pseudonocardia xinjiangensis]|uniref:Acyl--CoA ligase n=1 Tax=Pseudonocardia xinjiangensis TaxID=75289 RepID=A0ABX1RQP7_9PSEU|nr:class I adenylate-forming enzyme family protein [Pseudonocardia xinjiangensis]NMH81410.1 acyl--CoA ligase [Pseudonocardia xinjiangensis]
MAVLTDPYHRALRVGDVPRLHASNPASRDRVAVVEGEHTLTWQQLEDRSTGVAAGLAHYGVRSGEPVGLYAGNRIEYIELMYGLAKAGCPIVPLSPRLVAGEVARALRVTGATAIVTDVLDALGPAGAGVPDGELAVARLRDTSGDPVAPLHERAEDVRHYEDVVVDPAGARLPEIDESTPFRLALTSGTTGSPKVCVIPHRVTVQGWAEMSVELGIGPHDVELVVGPLFHGLGFTCALQQLYVGGTLNIHRRFDARHVLDSIAHDRPTVLPGAPVIFDRLADAAESSAEPVDTSSLRLVLSSGARAGGTLKRRLARAFPEARIGEFLAGTETACVTINLEDPFGPKAESCGRPFFRTEVAILNPDGGFRRAGEVGEVAKRGLLTGPVYLGDPKRTDEAFRDGWFRTGDLGYQDEDGFVFIAGRLKDVIVSGGINIYPAEIEEAIRGISGVREVAVVGVPDEEWGESVKAVVVLEDGVSHTPEDIEQRCRVELAGYKVPRVIAFIDALPRSPSGKVLNRELTDVPGGFRRTGNGWQSSTPEPVRQR